MSGKGCGLACNCSIPWTFLLHFFISYHDYKMDVLKEKMHESFVCKICINQGEQSTNSLFTSNFVISGICIA